MEGSICSRRRPVRGGVATILAGLALVGAEFRTRADEPRAAPAGDARAINEISTCLERTKSERIPTVVVVTSTKQPHSRAVWFALTTDAWVQSSRDRFQLVELPTEASPTLIERL